MSAPVYATTADLTAYCSPDPAPAGVGDRQLREASAQVDQMLLTAVYRVDADDRPVDPKVLEAVKNATCAQALHVLEHGDEVAIRQDDVPVALGPLSLGGGRRVSSSGSTGTSTPVWAPQAVAFLRAEGLIAGPVIT